MNTPALNWNLVHTYQTLPPLFYSPGAPADFPQPKTVLFNAPLARDLGLLPAADVRVEPQAVAEVLAGNRFPANARPIAQAYAGHQFGHFTLLGDGRALLLGEQITPDGQRIDIQLKGSGPTPYSRRGDGKAALGPMLREYLISEAMHALGIPTTRSLAVVTTGEPIWRDRPLPGAVLTRAAQSHIRVGTFQFALATGEAANVRALADYALQRHFPAILAENPANPYLALLQQVVQRQALLIAQWQLAGFVHGVMNTDNMAISGETIDYGPCAFMDAYDPDTVFSSIDRAGRYRYGHQPAMAQWNLARLAESLLDLLDDHLDEAYGMADDAVRQFMPQYQRFYAQGMRQKLGLTGVQDDDLALIDELLRWMQRHQADYTNTFVRLTLEVADADVAYLEGVAPLFASPELADWKTRWLARLAAQPQPRREIAALMQAHNPFIIARNHAVEAALQAAQAGDMQPLHTLLAALQQPWRYDAPHRVFQTLPPRSMMKYQTFCGT
ncbi:YdiU family protein [Allofranklinella schreckenbergeri]|uniref:Protein nucleotidyltransferase YdiU n=1 Tax=Allofranklinella schreckenbergeri TaxID=1076744 RepID=A0A3M6QT34_9BURK|nr:YdiU family protein [Allofranklinella schreckenbergeri]RMX06196.1 YdiU family protein [Allofranklinella schreckenbergeri]